MDMLIFLSSCLYASAFLKGLCCIYFFVFELKVILTLILVIIEFILASCILIKACKKH